MTLLAAERQRQPDDERIDLLIARDPLELGEIFDHAPSEERPERTGETVRVVANSEADAAVPDVERKVTQASGRPGRDGRLNFDRDPRIEDRKKRPPRGPCLHA